MRVIVYFFCLGFELEMGFYISFVFNDNVFWMFGLNLRFVCY